VAFDLLHAWDYAKLAEVFNGGWGATVSTMDELDDALKQAKKNRGLSLIDVPQNSITVQMLQQAGADPASGTIALKAAVAKAPAPQGSASAGEARRRCVQSATRLQAVEDGLHTRPVSSPATQPHPNATLISSVCA